MPHCNLMTTKLQAKKLTPFEKFTNETQNQNRNMKFQIKESTSLP